MTEVTLTLSTDEAEMLISALDMAAKYNAEGCARGGLQALTQGNGHALNVALIGLAKQAGTALTAAKKQPANPPKPKK